MSVMSKIQLHLLGPAELRIDGQPVELKMAKAMALLAYLAVTGTPQSRDHVTDLLWPDSLPDAARKNLRNTLWAIRKQAADNILSADSDWMALADTVSVDVRQFEQASQNHHDANRLQKGLDLYRGPLLEGLTVTDAPDFELWLATERERLGQLYLRLLEALATLQRQNQDWRGVQTTVRRALAADNLQEPMHQALMEAHARLGERADALRQYNLLVDILAQELGVKPLPETTRLRQAILDGSLSQQTTPAAGQPSPPPPRPARKQPSIFVGRQDELAVLTEQLQLTQQGQARVVLITGELGIGKTRLWQHWSASLPQTLTVLETRCLNTTQLLPFTPLTGLFSQSYCVNQLTRPDGPLSPIWLAELSRLLPEIRQLVPDLPTLPTLPPEEENRRLFEAFTQVLRALNGGPLVLFVDDLHWIDQATLDWLVYLIDRMQNQPLLLLGTYRPSDAPSRLSQVAAGWSRHNLLRRLPLSNLSLTETTALLTALGLTSEQIEQLQQKSAGNPYFLLELSRNDSNDTPPQLAELIQARLNRLPDTARQVLQAAAVLDNNFDFSTLRRTSGRGEEETIGGVEVLLEENLLIEKTTSYEFTHPLVAQVMRNNLSLARRSFLHRRAAQALESVFADRLDVMAGQLAHHYAQAGQPDKAAHFAEMAANRALKLTALTEAIGFYRQALTLEPTPERYYGLGQALAAHGEVQESRDQLHQAAAEFERAGDPAGLAKAYLGLSLSFLASSQGQQVIHFAEKALAQLKGQENPETLAQAHHLLAAGGLLVGKSLAEAEEHLQETIRLATDYNLLELAGSGRFELGNLLAQRGELEVAIKSFRRSLELSQAAGGLFQVVLAHNNLAYHLLLVGNLPAARQHIETALELAESHSLVSPRQYLFSTRGELALAEGALDDAESWFQRALIEADRNHNQPLAANVQANLGLVARKRGNFDEALLLLEAARQMVTGLTAVHLQSQIDLWLTELYLERDELTTAGKALARAEHRLAGSERKGLEAWARRLKTRLE